MAVHKPTIPIERAYFTLDTGTVQTHGSVNPSDGRNLPGIGTFLLVAVLNDGSKRAEFLESKNRSDAEAEAETVIDSDGEASEGFVCECRGFDCEQRSVYRSFALIEKQKPSQAVA